MDLWHFLAKYWTYDISSPNFFSKNGLMQTIFGHISKSTKGFGIIFSQDAYFIMCYLKMAITPFLPKVDLWHYSTEATNCRSQINPLQSTVRNGTWPWGISPSPRLMVRYLIGGTVEGFEMTPKIKINALLRFWSMLK